MTNIQKSVPVLRFKDELGNCYSPWGEKKFSFIAKKVNDSYKPTNNGESFECIELESLSSETGLLIRTFRSSEQKSMKTKFLTGDVLFGKLRPYLKKFYRSDFDGVCTSEIWVLRPKSVPSEFLFYVVQSGHFNRLANIQSGTKMPRSNWGIVSQSIFKIPSDYGEQQKIASFLSSVDTKIEQLGKKIALLEQYKKGMMQRLFSQEIRFKDEQGNSYPFWGEKKFSCIAEKINDSYKPKNNGESFQCIELESLSSETGLLIRTFKSDEQKSMKTKFLTGDVLFGKLRPYLKKFYRADFYGVCTSEIWVLRAKSVASEFLFYVVQSHHFNRVANVQSGSKMPRSDWGIVSQSIFKIPFDYQEQQKIANFLSAIDKKIELISEQLEQARTLKKGLLQQMFI